MGIITGMKTDTALEGAICNYEDKLKEEIRWRIKYQKNSNNIRSEIK